MDKIRTVKYNYIMNSLLTLASIVFPLITFPYVSRVLGATSYGKYSFASSLISYFSMFASLGIPTYGIRVCAKVRNDEVKLKKLVGELLVINAITTLVVMIVLVASVFCIPKLQENAALILVLSINIIFNVIGVTWLYSALEQYKYITVRSVAFKIVSLVLTFFLIKNENNYIEYAVIAVIAGSGSYIFNFIKARKYISFKHVTLQGLKSHCKLILVLFAASIAASIYTNLDTVMIGFMSTDIDVGYYTAAVKIKNILLSFISSLGSVLLPRMSYYYSINDQKSINSTLNKSMHYTLLIALPLTLFFMIMAKDSVLFLSGSDYSGAIVPMIIIMPTLFLVGLAQITANQMLIPQGHEQIFLYSTCLGAIIDLVLNFILIPSYGSAGAAIGTVGAEMGGLIFQIAFLKNQFFSVLFSAPWIKIICSNIICMVASFIVLNTFHMTPFFHLLLVGITYFGIYFILMLILKDAIVKEILFIAMKIVKRRKIN